MPKNKPLATSRPESIEEAWDRRDKVAVLNAMIKKYARVLDMTDSGRDIKPLASGMLETIAQLEALEGDISRSEETPLASVLRMAQ